MSGFAFGLIIGYLSWYAFRPGETPEPVPIQKIAALLAVIGGATVLALFPTGTILFEYYGLGLAVGFFFPPISNWTRIIFQSLQTSVKKRFLAKESKHKKEIQDIEENWLQIERLVRQKLDTSPKADERIPRADYIDITDLQELQYSQPTIEFIMRRFAQMHVRDGVEYRVWNGKPSLFKRRW